MADDDKRLFDPARMPERDAYGHAYHPDFDTERWTHPMFGEEHVCPLKLAQAGFAFTHRFCEPGDGDYPEDFDLDGADCSKWDPPDLSAEGWIMVGVGDTENGFCAWYVRPVTGDEQAALIAKERAALDELKDGRSRSDRH